MSEQQYYPYHNFIPGDVNFPVKLYSDIAENVEDADIICEIGCLMGRTTVMMTELLDAYNKSPKFYAIDMFGSYLPDGDVEALTGRLPWGEQIEQWADRVGGTAMLIDQFDFHMTNNPFAHKVTDRVQFPPWHSSEEFDDNSVFFVMLNASRDPRLINKQLEKWIPKLESRRGTLAVYGTDDEKVRNAVEAFCFAHKTTLETNTDYHNTVVVYHGK